MQRNGQEVVTTDRHSFVLNHGALGDVICSLPAIIKARQDHPRMAMKVWCPPWQMELVGHLLAPYGEFEIADFREFPLKWEDRKGSDIGPVSLNSVRGNQFTRNRIHMVNYAFNVLTDSQPESLLEASYPTAAPDTGFRLATPSQYIVFPVGATSGNKLFKAAGMAPIIDWVIEQGYTPVLVGTKTSHTHSESANSELTPLTIVDEADKLPALVEHYDRVVDLREQTTLLQLRDLCGFAAAVVGMDGGTLHLAGTTDTNIVYGMTTTVPKHRFIARHGDPNYKIRYVIPRDLECAGCQSTTTMTSWDFRNCAFGDNKCVDQMHPEDFINALKELGL